MRVVLVAKPGNADTGVGRYSGELDRALRQLGQQVTIVDPVVPFPEWLVRWLRRMLGVDLKAFFFHYPVWARYPDADVYHLTSQNLATLLLFHPPPGKTIVTVHDIIPWIVRRDPKLRVYQHWLHETFDRLAIMGLKRADAIIVDSADTARSLVDNLRLRTIHVC